MPVCISHSFVSGSGHHRVLHSFPTRRSSDLGLLQSSPTHNSRGFLPSIPGQPPSLLIEQKACAFAPRCPAVMDICRRERPPLRTFEDGTQSLCWLEDKAVRVPAATPPLIEEPAQTDAPADPIIRVTDVRLTYGGQSLFGRKAGT